ncbi:MAG: sigma-54-dependent transcriptional regulator [Terriglobales bacterium]
MKKYSATNCKILVVDDDASLAHTLRHFLEEQGYSVEVALSAAEALELQQSTRDLCLALVDLLMPVTDGLTLMERLRQRDPDLPVIVMTGFATIETAVESVKRGAEDYITKPLDPDTINKKVGRIMEMVQLRSRVEELEAHFQERHTSFESLVYVSPAMQRVVELARTSAETGASVLLLGETGTGKEMIARAIHGASKRSSAPFVAVNCGALPRELVESELFGYRRGAFTGAYTDAPGLFVAGHRGTIFLDEVGEMPKEAQVKMLRVLQEKELRPVGGTKPVPVDVRIIAATNRPVSELRSTCLREDLYFRIATVVIDIPPLRLRPEDTLVLAQHFARRLSERYDRDIVLSRSAMELLLEHPLPGNVRELENLLEAVAAVSRDDPQRVTDKDLASRLQRSAISKSPAGESEQPVVLEQLEHMAIQRALRMTHGNRRKAASLLGISRDTLYRKLREMEPEPDQNAFRTGKA